MNWKKYLLILSSIIGLLSLSGCKGGVWNPMGVITAQEKHLLIFATVLMLFVVIPVIILTLLFAWKYRDGADSEYRPTWSHSNKLEIICWGVPFVIILVLAIVTWKTTHSLSPYKALESDKKPLEIDVVALNWKWMFIYPEQDIATVNYIEIPKDRPVNFKITSAAPMNSFFIPELAGQIYAMTGMTTQLHLIATNEGKYRGFSANYTGEGFAGMQFYTKVTSQNDFDNWVKEVKDGKHQDLTWDYFWSDLVKDSENNPVAYYSHVDKNLFGDIVMSYMMPNYKPGDMAEGMSGMHMHH
ncbi:cytochrome O ubiquinol oxidase [Candidatus Francisella endociliophora]|uniref:Ubiquinol oxidase subunit 2 n=1 Tax=Candidatus Francisella endociliophora TaxID=653937 RepID=A0A097EQC9_9GAMM|nr:ubiquinol oxidase subunit II [Francisella sp. FSC1006]AIT09772.1 cytochrome O ubiquinol oxidase [Francisella sp. FSC1006]